MEGKMLYQEESYNIIGAALEVHKNLGNGFLEGVYSDALAIEFSQRKIPYEREKKLTIKYKDCVLGHYYIADFVCYGNIIVELKALSAIDNSHYAQVLNYLKATGYPLGLLINFGEVILKTKRIVR